MGRCISQDHAKQDKVYCRIWFWAASRYFSLCYFRLAPSHVTMAPPSYADIGKQARDVFGKGEFARLLART